MKILHITPEIAPWSKAGGLGGATAALAKNLAALGHEVRVVELGTFSAAGIYVVDYDKLIDAVDRLAGQEVASAEARP